MRIMGGTEDEEDVGGRFGVCVRCGRGGGVPAEGWEGHWRRGR